MIKNKEKVINEIGDEVITTLAITFMEKQEDLIKQAAKQRGRTYSSFLSANRNGMGRRWWLPAVKTAISESLYAAAATDTSKSKQRFKEESLKQSLKTYMMAA